MPRPQFKLGDMLIPALTVTECYKYLGIMVSPSGVAPEVEKKLNDSIRQLTRASLKPQQRLWILKTKVIPTLYHQLVLADPTKGHLEYLDLSIRKAVRQWTRLPHDIALPAF